MKSILILAAAVFAPAAFGELLEVRATACGAGNNCQRGVGGTAGVKPPLSSRLADCSSLYTVTVIPATYTTTTTSTSTSWTTTSTTITIAPRDVSTAMTVQPTAVPTYATYCDNASKYYSACSCAGVTPATSYAPTPTETVTVTTTVICPYNRKLKRGMEQLRNWGWIE